MKKKFVCILIVLSTLFVITFSGCNKSHDIRNANYDDPNWKKDRINELLKYVPADTPMVLATTRQHHLHHPVYEALFNRASENMDILNVDRMVLDDDAVFEEFMKPKDDDLKRSVWTNLKYIFMFTFNDLYNDYYGFASQYGLNPIHYDFVLYYYETQPVIKISVDDGDKLEASLHQIKENDVRLAGYFTDKTMNADGQEWTLVTVYAAASEDNPEMKRVREQVSNKCESLKSNSSEYRSCLVTLSGIDDRLAHVNEQRLIVSGPRTFNFAVHFDKDVVTLLPFADESQMSHFKNYLKPAANPIEKTRIGKMTPETLAMGFVDMNRILKETDLIQQVWGSDCINDIKMWFEHLKRIDLNVIAQDSRAVMEADVAFTNSDDIAKLQAYKKPGLVIPKQDLMFGVNINADVSKIIADLRSFSVDSSNLDSSCGIVNSFSHSLNDFFAKMNQHPAASMVFGFLEGLSNVTFFLDHYYYYHPEIKTEFLVNFSGETLDFSLGFIQGMFMLDDSGSELVSALSTFDEVQKVKLPFGGEGSEPTEASLLRTQDAVSIAVGKYRLDQVPKKHSAEDAPLMTLYFGRRASEIYNLPLTSSEYAEVAAAVVPNFSKKSIDTFAKIHEKTIKNAWYNMNLSLFSTNNGAKLLFDIDLGY